MQTTTTASASVAKTSTHLQAFQNSVVLHDMDLRGVLDTFRALLGLRRVLETQRIRVRVDWESERVGKTSSLGIPLRVLLRRDAHRTKQNDFTALQDLRIHEFTHQSSTARLSRYAHCVSGGGRGELLRWAGLRSPDHSKRAPRPRLPVCVRLELGATGLREVVAGPEGEGPRDRALERHV